jgi:hypothetical protein
MRGVLSRTSPDILLSPRRDKIENFIKIKGRLLDKLEV